MFFRGPRIMAVYKLLCFVVLCFVYHGAAEDVVGAGCGYVGYKGTCTPIEWCQPTQVMRTVNGRLKGCDVHSKKTVICCLDTTTNNPFIYNVNYLTNFFLSVIPKITPTPTSGPTYNTGTGFSLPPMNIIPPRTQSPTHFFYPRRTTASPSKPRWPTTNAATPRWTTTNANTPRPTTTKTNPSTAPSSIPSMTPSVTPSTSTTRNSTTTTNRPVATTPRTGPTTTEYIPMVYDYVTTQPFIEGCKEIDPKLTANKTGRAAWDKCVDYQEQLVFPCQRSASLLGNMVRVKHCARAEPSGAEETQPNEFPHMVVLGVRSRPDTPLRWACVGTLISEWFVLTSAHCWAQRNERDALYATLGTLQRMSGNTDVYQEHRIQSITFYGQPNGFSRDTNGYVKYHDIALLKTATEIQLNQWIIPACLDTGGNYPQAVAARWRVRSWDEPNGIQKIFLHQLEKLEYQKRFDSSIRKRTHAIANQMGYGSHSNSIENCKYIHEGSLTVENQRIKCMYTVIGLSSDVMAACGPSLAGSYTRIVDYTSWIEQIVWPEDSV